MGVWSKSNFGSFYPVSKILLLRSELKIFVALLGCSPPESKNCLLWGSRAPFWANLSLLRTTLKTSVVQLRHSASAFKICYFTPHIAPDGWKGRTQMLRCFHGSFRSKIPAPEASNRNTEIEFIYFNDWWWERSFYDLTSEWSKKRERETKRQESSTWLVMRVTLLGQAECDEG